MAGWQYDDGGREAAGYPGITGDCVARALSVVWRHENPYYTPAMAYCRVLGVCLLADEVAVRQGAGGRDDCDTLHQRAAGFYPYGLRGGGLAADALGFRIYSLPRSTTLEQLQRAARRAALVVSFPTHLSAVVNGVWRDTGDVRDPEFNTDPPDMVYVPVNGATAAITAGVRLPGSAVAV